MVTEFDLEDFFGFGFWGCLKLIFVLLIDLGVIFMFVIFDGYDDFFYEIEEAVEIVIGVYAADIAASFEDFFELEFHVFVEIELLQIVDDTDAVDSA